MTRKLLLLVSCSEWLPSVRVERPCSALILDDQISPGADEIGQGGHGGGEIFPHGKGANADDDGVQAGEFSGCDLAGIQRNNGISHLCRAPSTLSPAPAINPTVLPRIERSRATALATLWAGAG